MPKAYIQLGASGSSPSICPARATGCPVGKLSLSPTIKSPSLAERLSLIHI